MTHDLALERSARETLVVEMSALRDGEMAAKEQLELAKA